MSNQPTTPKRRRQGGSIRITTRKDGRATIRATGSAANALFNALAKTNPQPNSK